MSDSLRLAAIDIGTVTTRMVVADVSNGRIVEVDRSTDITHLGEGLTASGVLAPAALRRVDDVIARYAIRMAELDVTGVLAVATSASRDASNAAEFVDMLERRGVHPEVIDGIREATLTFRGATLGRDASDVLVNDIGGGSTELIFGASGSSESSAGLAAVPALVRSVDVGSRRITELYLHSDPITQAELTAARRFVAGELRSHLDALVRQPREVISVAGTATTLAAIVQEMEVYDSARIDGFRLNGSDISDLLEHLASLTLEQRSSVIGLHPGRAGVIVAGTLILETLLALAGVDSTLVSEQDILYGILLEAYERAVGSTGAPGVGT